MSLNDGENLNRFETERFTSQQIRNLSKSSIKDLNLFDHDSHSRLQNDHDVSNISNLNLNEAPVLNTFTSQTKHYKSNSVKFVGKNFGKPKSSGENTQEQ